jgi:hypothetical protein
LADYLSRSDHQNDPVETSSNLIQVEPEVNWNVEQSSCAEIKCVIELIKTENDNREDCLKLEHGSSWYKERLNMYMFNNILHFGVNRVVVPKHLRSWVLNLYHDSAFAGHRGSETTLYNISFRFFWPFLRRDIVQYCQTCVKCQVHNTGPVQAKAPLIPIVATRPSQIVSLDFVGPLKTTRNGNLFFIFGIDKFTKFLEGTATKNFTAQTSALFLHNEWICRHGAAEVVLTDRGVNFEAHLFKHLCAAQTGANKARTTAFHPQANGGAERIIRNIKPNLAKYIDFDQENWDVYLPLAISAYNNSYHSSIGMTPFEAHFCRPSVKLHDIILNNPLPSSTKPKDISEFIYFHICFTLMKSVHICVYYNIILCNHKNFLSILLDKIFFFL